MNNANRPPNCRIFLGNLASEKTSRKELHDIFSKYGEIVEEIVLRRSFGFIQYDNPISAKNAMDGENGRLIGGIRVDISLADNREPRTKRQRSDRDREHDRERDNERDRERNNGGRSGVGVTRDRKRGRFDDAGRDFRGERSNRVSGFSNQPQPIVLQVVYLTTTQRRYAESVRQAVQDQLGLAAETYYIDRMSVEDVIMRASRRNMRYVFVVGNQHERRSTVDCTLLLHGRPEVYKEITISEAMDMVGRSEAFISQPPQQHPPPQNPLGGASLPGPSLPGLDPALLLQLLTGQLASPQVGMPSVGPGVGIGTAAPPPVQSMGRLSQPPMSTRPPGGGILPAPVSTVHGGGGNAALNTTVLNSLQSLITSLQQQQQFQNITPTTSSAGPTGVLMNTPILQNTSPLTQQQPSLSFHIPSTGDSSNLQSLLAASAPTMNPPRTPSASTVQSSSTLYATTSSPTGQQPLPGAQPQGGYYPLEGLSPDQVSSLLLSQAQASSLPGNIMALLAPKGGTSSSSSSSHYSAAPPTYASVQQQGPYANK